MNEIEIKVKQVFAETFPTCSLESYSKDLGVGDLSAWDSLGNFNFLMALEANFSVRFDIDQMSSLKNIHTIVDTIVNLQS